MQRQRYSNLPEETVLEILSWLPAKSIGRCRCVSKSWRALLSQPQFIQTHVHKTRILNHKSFLLSNSTGYLFISEAHHVSNYKFTLSATKLNIADLPRHRKCIRASCDGLVLVGDCYADHINWLINPITGEIREVPPFPFAPAANVVGSMGLLYGLGYDSASHDYKIIVIYYIQVSDPPVSSQTVACLYSLKCGSWKSLGNFPYYRGDSDPVFINGCLHWRGARTMDKRAVIVAFDLLEEKFHELLFPKSWECVPIKLGLLGGCLSVYDSLENSVWVMKEYSIVESWTRFVLDARLPCFCSHICFLGEEQLVMFYGKKYFSYNLRQRTSMDIVINDNSQRYKIERISFVESLVSPHDGPWLS